jgi:hypothetical protein
MRGLHYPSPSGPNRKIRQNSNQTSIRRLEQLQSQGLQDELPQQSIVPIQQFAYTQGENATDSGKIIDAVDLLYSGRYDGFRLTFSDRDFTRLARSYPRVRTRGVQT